MARKRNEEEAEQSPVAGDAAAEEPPAGASEETEVEAAPEEPQAAEEAEIEAAQDEQVVEAELPVNEAPSVAEPAEEEVAVAEPEAVEEPAPAKAPARRAARSKPKQAAKPKAKRGARAGEATRERKPIVRLPKPERVRGGRKERRGTVVSSAMDKTIVVRVDTVKPHPRYKKVVRRSTKFHAHDEENVAKPGDVVRIVATRPLSKTKSWRLVEVVEAAR
jgi:small subunit ribosomal protein S17